MEAITLNDLAIYQRELTTIGQHCNKHSRRRIVDECIRIVPSERRSGAARGGHGEFGTGQRPHALRVSRSEKCHGMVGAVRNGQQLPPLMGKIVCSASNW